MDIRKITLQRTKQQDLFMNNGIKGKLIILSKNGEDWHTTSIATLENLKYIFPEGNYWLKYEYSPKFNKYLWEFYGINGRTEIKIHAGSHPEHSKGCVLLHISELERFHKLLDKNILYKITVK